MCASSPEPERRAAVARQLGDAGLDASLVTAAANLRYLTGFTGTNGWLLLATGTSILLTDSRYLEQAQAQTEGVQVITGAKGLLGCLGATLDERGWQRLGYDPQHTTVALEQRLCALEGVDWVCFSGVVETLRSRKGAAEIEAMGRALELTVSALLGVAEGVKPGSSEREIAAELEYACRRRGADGMAFETIVASGPRTALPHGLASDRRVQIGEPLMIDVGCRLDGYCSDLTRMVWVGDEVDREWLQLYRVVQKAQAAAIDVIGPGVAAAAVDRAAREVIEDAGYGEAFSHGTGHGVGLEIHEAPSVSPRSEDRLEAGMVITIEPAIYQPVRRGIRLEDMLCVNADGCVRLTPLGADPILA
ncbi:MAG: M24 family metallopeptidase [Acidobacteriota bacterium]